MNAEFERLIEKQVESKVAEFLRKDIFITAADEPGHVEVLFTLESDTTKEIQIKATLDHFVYYITEFDSAGPMIKWADWLDEVSKTIRDKASEQHQRPINRIGRTDSDFAAMVASHLPDDD
jgi:hypothetical protein